MQDNALHDFINEIRQRGLVKKAETFCASWETGYVAQDPSGDVYLYNAEICVTSDNWFFPEQNAGYKFHRLAHLDAVTQWQDRCLPVPAMLQPQPDLNDEQQAFLQALTQAGIREQIRQFLNAWQYDSWLALDPDGRLYIFNNCPERSPIEWINGAPDIINSWARLDALSDHQLNWRHCLVRLSQLQRQLTPPKPIEINNAGRMDCWS